MADNTGGEGEEALFEIIRSLSRPDDLNEANDGSQYLNNTGEGNMISMKTSEGMKYKTIMIFK